MSIFPTGYKVMSLPVECSPTWVDSCLHYKYKTRMGVTDSDKNSSSLHNRINFGPKILIGQALLLETWNKLACLLPPSTLDLTLGRARS